MSRRLDNIRQNQLATLLGTMEDEMQQLRSGAPQFIGGSSIRYYTSQTSATWDWTGKMVDPSGSGYGGKLFLLTAVANNMPVFWGGAAMALYIDSSTNYYGGLAYMTDYKNANSPMTTTITDVPNNTLQPNQKQWYVQIAGNSSRNCWVKFSVQGIDTATITVQQLN